MSIYGHSIFTLALATLLITIPSSSADDKFIHDKCQFIIGPGENVDLCANFLKEDPRSLNANLEQLTQISCQLAQRKVAELEQKYRALLNNPNNDYDLFLGLLGCATDYSAVQSLLGFGLNAMLTKHDYNFEYMRPIMSVPTACSDGFKVRPMPLAEENAAMTMVMNYPVGLARVVFAGQPHT